MGLGVMAGAGAKPPPYSDPQLLHLHQQEAKCQQNRTPSKCSHRHQPAPVTHGLCNALASVSLCWGSRGGPAPLLTPLSTPRARGTCSWRTQPPGPGWDPQ